MKKEITKQRNTKAADNEPIMPVRMIWLSYFSQMIT